MKMMVCGSEGEILQSKMDPCGVCGKRVMSNSLLCTKCNKWIHGRCAKVRKVTSHLARAFVCQSCEKGNCQGSPTEEMGNGIKTVNGFCYLDDKLNACGGCEAAVTARTRLGWAKFRECRELLFGERFSLKDKGKVYRYCVRSAMLYGSETWCLKENEMAILRRTERAMVRAMCGVKLSDRRNSATLMGLLGLKETADKLAKANGVRWYGHVLRREDNDILQKALTYEVDGPRKRGRPKKMWKKQVEESSIKIGLRMEDANKRTLWREGVKAIAAGIEWIRPPP